ncbi:peptidase S58 family protein [Pontibacillus yanchengensis]|uniref:Peptidase S58 family protein n=2 Tax=Pontibacillus yanchengensis TaxID=462910 RepID=A0ACC7VCT6_9BACI|nr:peptidase S58 family protein [Pontibacillus yanchengensis]MYL51759.1 peptidase S58 family protein [Pontibacillus yanchengensis]
MERILIQNIKGFKIGHAEHLEGITGCTTIICPEGAIAGFDVRGGAPGTRETDLLSSENLVDTVHAIFMSGGSAYGLDVGSGIMKFLEEQQIGFDVQVARVPIVPGAVLFDLAVGSPNIRPNHKLGYLAAQNAYQLVDEREGSIGAGTGATVGKCLGMDHSMKGGIGTFAVKVGDLQIGAIVAVNSFGDIFDPDTGDIIAGVYDQNLQSYLSTESIMFESSPNQQETNRFSGNTSIATVLTNAKLTKANANKISSMAHDGFARTMRPSHSMVDGDTVFTMSSNEIEADLNVVGHLASYVIQQAVGRAIKEADSLGGIISYKDLNQ